MVDEQRTAAEPPSAYTSLLFPLVAIAAILAPLPLGTETPDLVQYFIPWMTAVHQGGLSSRPSRNTSFSRGFCTKSLVFYR